MGRPSKAEIAARAAAQDGEHTAAMNDAAATVEGIDVAVTQTATIDTEEPAMGIPAEEISAKNKDDVIRQMQAQIAELEKQLAGKNAAPSVVLAKPEEVVKVTYISNVSDSNVLDLGEFGSMTGVGWVLEVPRKDFAGKFMTPFVQKLLKKRRLIVLDGLTDEERERYGVAYRDGELLDAQMFGRLLTLPAEKVIEIYKNLCPEHRRFAATRFITAFERGDNRINRGLIEPLQEISKADDPQGLFTPILQKMNNQSI